MSIKIEDINLSVRAYNCLRRAGIKTIDEIDINELHNLRNCGERTIKEIQEKISINNADNMNFALNTKSHYLSDTNIKDLAISFKLKGILRDNNINTLEQLITEKIDVDASIQEQYDVVYNYFYNLVYGSIEEIDISEELEEMSIRIPFNTYKFEKGEFYQINEIVDEVVYNFNNLNTNEKINIKLFLHWINLFEIKDNKKYFLENLKLTEKEIDIITKRTYKTLEEIGMEYKVTRERIRQIEKKTVKKIRYKYSKIPFKFLNPKKIYYMDECSEFELLMLYIDSVTDKKYIFVQNNAQKYFLPNYYVKYINKIIKNNKKVLDYYGYIELNEDGYSAAVIKAIEYLGFNYNNNFITVKATKRAQVKYAMRYLNKPISLSNNDDINLIIKVVKCIFGTEIESRRSIEVIINDVGVRVGSGSYSADDIVIPLTTNLLMDIKTYVKEKEIINARDLFINFGTELYEHNLRNEFILYRYLKEELGNELYFNGVSTVISSNKDLSSWGDVVIKTIKQTNKPISKHDFMLKYSLTEAVYSTLAVNFNDIIVWGSKELYLKSMINVPKDIIAKITEEIYSKQIMSFEEIKNKINQYDAMLLKNNNVNNNENLYYFLTNIFSEDIVIDKKYEEVRYKNKRNKIINEEYQETEELTI